jgi:hypothetical protein
MEQSPPPTSAPASASAVRAWDRPLVMLPLFVLIAAIGGLFGSFTLSANLLVLAVGGTLVWLGLSGRVARRPAPTSLPRGTVWWLAPILGLALVELFAFTHNSPQAYPTLSLLADPVLDGYLARAAAYFLWLTAFWGLVRR